MEISQSLMYVLLPLVGVIIGATLQYLFQRRSEEQKHRQNLRTQAYVDFLQATGRLAIAQRNNDKDKERELIAFLTDIKARICVYGSKEVIEKFVKFDHVGATTSKPEGVKALINLIQAMRKDSLPKEEVKDEAIYKILFQ